MPAASVYHYGYPYEQQSGDDEEYCDRQEREQEFQITQAEIDRTYLAGAELGKRNISLKSLEKIVNALNVSFEEFFKGL